MGGLGPGFAATGGAGLLPATGGLGFVATGGAGFPPPSALDGLEESESSGVEDEGVFFQGVGEPFEGPIPGNTDTGFADGLALIADGLTDATGVAAGLGVGAGAGALRGGGGGAAGAALGGTSSR